jgi:hypothetical protein
MADNARGYRKHGHSRRLLRLDDQRHRGQGPAQLGKSDTLLTYVGVRQVLARLPRCGGRLAQVRDLMHRRAPLGEQHQEREEDKGDGAAMQHGEIA